MEKDRSDRSDRGSDRSDRSDRDRSDRSDRGSDRGSDSSDRGSKKPGRSKYRQDLSGDHNFDYKDPLAMMRFVGDGGKITPSRISKLSVAQQKQVAAAIKKSRNLALLPTGMDAHDHFYRVEAISPVPFEI